MFEGEERERGRTASGPTGNSPSEIRRGAIDFRSGNDQYAGRRGGRRRASERASEGRGGGKSIHCFEETRRARVPAHRPANGASFGGSMRQCVLPRRLRSLCFRPSLSRLFFSLPRPLSSTRYAFCSFRRVSLSISAPTHPPCASTLARNDSQGPRPSYICGASSRCKYPRDFQ